MSNQKVNPAHYKLPNGLEAYEVTQHFDFTTGNAIKYLWRAGKKENEYRLTDLKKAQWYLNQLIEREELNELSSKTALPKPNSLDRHYFVSDYFVAEDLNQWRDAT